MSYRAPPCEIEQLAMRDLAAQGWSPRRIAKAFGRSDVRVNAIIADVPQPARYCVICRGIIPRHELDTDTTYRSRDVCGRACMRALKGTQAQRGARRWHQEERA